MRGDVRSFRARGRSSEPDPPSLSTELRMLRCAVSALALRRSEGPVHRWSPMTRRTWTGRGLGLGCTLPGCRAFACLLGGSLPGLSLRHPRPEPERRAWPGQSSPPQLKVQGRSKALAKPAQRLLPPSEEQSMEQSRVRVQQRWQNSVPAFFRLPSGARSRRRSSIGFVPAVPRSVLCWALAALDTRLPGWETGWSSQNKTEAAGQTTSSVQAGLSCCALQRSYSVYG